MKKKILFIVLPIVLAILIVGGVIAAIILGSNKSVGSTWGDTYYAYLKEAINEDDLSDAEEKYGMKLNMKDAKLQFCEVDENEAPSMIMTYSKNENSYVNVYQINDDKKVVYVAYKQPTQVEYLYNIEKNEYGWYVHENNSSSDSYSSLKNVVSNLKENSSKSEKSDNVNIAELEADYTINKDEAEITQETLDGDTLSMSKFDQIFVKPDVKLNEQFDFDIDITEKELKKAITTAVEDYKKESKILTDEVKEEVSKKAEEAKNKTSEIENAKKKLNQQQEMKVTQSDLIAKLGDHLKYFSACYLGNNYGPYQLYKLEDVSGKVKVPGTNSDMVVEEVVGLSSISELENDLKKYMTDDVISRLKSDGRKSITADMHEYNGKVYIVRGGIGDGPAVYWDKAKLISCEGDTTKVELEDYSLLGDYVEAKITVTIKYDEENSNFKVTDYSIKNLEYQSPESETPQTTNETSQGTNSQANSSTGSTSSSSNKLTAFEYDTSANNQIATGTYYRGKDTGTESELTISNSTANSFDFKISAIYMTQAGYPNIGEISGTAKAIKGGGFVYTESTGGSSYGYDYNIFFRIAGSGSNPTITIDDECYWYSSGLSDMSPYCGHNVTFEGTYSK